MKIKRKPMPKGRPASMGTMGWIWGLAVHA
jgi:hypothetical protein